MCPGRDIVMSIGRSFGIPGWKIADLSIKCRSNMVNMVFIHTNSSIMWVTIKHPMEFLSSSIQVLHLKTQFYLRQVPTII